MWETLQTWLRGTSESRGPDMPDLGHGVMVDAETWAFPWRGVELLLYGDEDGPDGALLSFVLNFRNAFHQDFNVVWNGTTDPDHDQFVSMDTWRVARLFSPVQIEFQALIWSRHSSSVTSWVSERISRGCWRPVKRFILSFVTMLWRKVVWWTASRRCFLRPPEDAATAGVGVCPGRGVRVG